MKKLQLPTIFYVWTAFVALSAATITIEFVACDTVQQGNDPVVVNAERTTAAAVDTFDSLFKLEANNHAFIKDNVPQVANGVNMLRARAPQLIQNARNLTKAYKNNRNAENKANLLTALAVLEQAINEARGYISQIGAAH